MKNKETLSNCHRIKEIKAAQQLNLMSYVEGDPRREKGHQLKNKERGRKIYEIRINSGIKLVVMYPFWHLTVTNVSWYCKMLITGETR